MSLLTSALATFAEQNCVNTALFGEVCDACNGAGVNFVLLYTIEAMIFGIGIMAVVGLLVFGLQYLTSGSNAGQIAKAKGRLRNMIIGVVTYIALITIVQFLSPGGIKGLVVTPEDSCPEKTTTEIVVVEPPEPGDSDGSGGTSGGGGGSDQGGDTGGGDSGGGSESTAEDRFEMHFVSAGGYYDDTIIIRNKNGAVLVDGGRMKAKDLLSYIKGIGVTKLTAMIGSHIEEDHVKVQKDIASSMIVGRAYYPVKPSSCEPYCNSGGKTPLVAAEKAGLNVVIPQAGSTHFDLGKMKVYFIGTNRNTWGRDANYSSIVNLIKYGDTSFMITGDKENICNGDNVSYLHHAASAFGISSLKVDVYKWPHHGNSGCTNTTFLKELSPKYAIVPNNGASWSVCKDTKCNIAKSTWGSGTKWLTMKSYKYIVFVSDGKKVTVEYNKEPSYWANYWKTVGSSTGGDTGGSTGGDTGGGTGGDTGGGTGGDTGGGTQQQTTPKKVIIALGASQIARIAGSSYLNLRNYTSSKTGQKYSVSDGTLNFVYKSGSGYSYQSGEGWATVNSIFNKFKDKKSSIQFYVFFTLVGNDIKNYACSEINASNQSLVSQIAKYNSLISEKKNQGYQVTGYVTSMHPLEVNNSNKGSAVVTNSDRNKCNKGYRSNYKYKQYNMIMQGIVKRYGNLTYLDTFSTIMNSSYQFTSSWKNYKTTDGIHWNNDTASRYFTLWMNKSGKV